MSSLIIVGNTPIDPANKEAVEAIIKLNEERRAQELAKQEAQVRVKSLANMTDTDIINAIKAGKPLPLARNLDEVRRTEILNAQAFIEQTTDECLREEAILTASLIPNATLSRGGIFVDANGVPVGSTVVNLLATNPACIKKRQTELARQNAEVFFRSVVPEVLRDMQRNTTAAITSKQTFQIDSTISTIEGLQEHFIQGNKDNPFILGDPRFRTLFLNELDNMLVKLKDAKKPPVQEGPQVIQVPVIPEVVTVTVPKAEEKEEGEKKPAPNIEAGPGPEDPKRQAGTGIILLVAAGAVTAGVGWYITHRRRRKN